MWRSIVLVVGLLTFVSGQTTPEHGTGCDVAVLRLENMLYDLTRRVNDLENQRQADVIVMSDIKREMAEVKNENRVLKAELDNMNTTKCGRQSPDPDSQPSTLDTGVDNSQPSTSDTEVDDSQPPIRDTETGTGNTLTEGNMTVRNTSKVVERIRSQSPNATLFYLINRAHTESGGGPVAFYARLGHVLFDVAKEQVIHFEIVITNNGGHYSQHSGVFTCGTEGTYVFSWTVFVTTNHWIDTELVKNGYVLAFNRAGDANFNEASSTTAVVNLSPGDMVWTRVNDRQTGADIKTHGSMFSGFKI